MNKIATLKDQNILFLQGPMGRFFRDLSHAFQKKGANTFTIGFNMGDYFFADKANFTAFKDTPEAWTNFIRKFLIKHKIDKIFLFGDCRHYQRIAQIVASTQHIDVYVFEEGYLRPHYITLEKFGVNGFSQLSRDADFYDMLPLTYDITPEHADTSKFQKVTSATIYYALSKIFNRKYPHYVHHRGFSPFKEFRHAIRDVWRKLLYKVTERTYLEKITHELSKKYYFVPLQTHTDFQILQHSNYRSIEKFIIHILESFAQHAPKDTYLIFKHHPVDRGKKNYTRFIKEQANILEIEERILSFHDVHLPSCLDNAIGTITINSTVGLSSIGHGIPTITLGESVYDIERLNNKSLGLQNFWYQYQKPDLELYLKFKHYLIQTTQLNGSFYGKMPEELS